jgi:hypothetical protein
MKIIFTEPFGYCSYLEEKHYFHWLEEIPRVKKVVWTPPGLEVTIEGDLDIQMLREFIALLSRYKLDMTCLREYCLAVDKEYFYNKEAHWFDSMFNEAQEKVLGKQAEAGLKYNYVNVRPGQNIDDVLGEKK